MKVEKDMIREAVERIPCEISVLTFDGKTGSAWLGCNECCRCLLLKALSSPDPALYIIQEILKKPLNGGYELREDLRNQTGRLIHKPSKSRYGWSAHPETDAQLQAKYGDSKHKPKED